MVLLVCSVLVTFQRQAGRGEVTTTSKADIDLGMEGGSLGGVNLSAIQWWGRVSSGQRPRERRQGSSRCNGECLAINRALYFNTYCQRSIRIHARLVPIQTLKWLFNEEIIHIITPH